MIHPTLRPMAWALLLLTLVATAGCGRADYEKRMQARLVEFRHLAKFRILNEFPTELLPGSSELTVRMPIKLGTRFTSDSKDPYDSNKPLDPKRLQPPFLPLPGLIWTYEQLLRDTKGNQLAYSMYVAAEKQHTDEGAEKPAPLEATLLTQLKAALPELSEEALKKLEWKDAPCTRPEPISPPKPGVDPVYSTVPWRSIEVDCDQEFLGITEGGANEFFKLPGIFKLFLYEHKIEQANKGETRYFVIFGWRVPKVLVEEKKIPPEESMDYLMNLIGGTLKVDPPPPAP